MGEFQIAGVWTRSELELHINVLELKAVILALKHWVAVLQGHHVMTLQTIPFPRPVEAGSRFVSVATDSGHNSSGQTHSGLPKCNSRPVISAEPAHHNRVKSPPRGRESDIQTVGK